MSQDLFQQAMDRILARAPGCVSIADDVVVYGRKNAEHDKNLLRLMQVAKEEGLVFNSKKCAIKTNEIVFFGSVYGKDGIKPDPSKIDDIRKMPTPQDSEDVQRFTGLMNYLALYTSVYRISQTRCHRCENSSRRRTSNLINEQLLQRRYRMIRDHDRRAGPELPVLHAGQRVRILNKETHLWSSGEIATKCAEPRSYIVQNSNGTRLRRTESAAG